MNHLFRELAPVSDAAWAEIESEATRTLRNFLAGRKVVDLTGPLGWEYSAANLGRVKVLPEPLAAGVEAGDLGLQALQRALVEFIGFAESASRRGQLSEAE